MADCTLNPANSSIASVPGNAKAIAVTYAVTLSEQNFLGTHQVSAMGVDAEGLNSPFVELGAFAVSQGEDFTITVTPGDPTLYTAVPPGQQVTLTVTVAGLNGFNANAGVGLSLNVGQHTQNTYCFGLVGGPGSLNAAGQTTITLQNNCGVSGAYEQFEVIGTAPALGVNHTASNTWLLSGGSGDFSIAASSPSAPTLTPQTPVSYTIAVTSISNETGQVNLSPGTLPAGVTAQFSPPYVILTSGSTGYSALTISGSATTPGGTNTLTVTGQLGSLTHTAAISLGTLVTTPSAPATVILNNNQQTQLSITYSTNSPAITSCSAPGAVSCSVNRSSPGSATLSITAPSSASHGTYVVYLNQQAVPIHVPIYDASISASGWPSGITAGQTVEFTAACMCPDPDDSGYAAAPADVWLTGPSAGDWVYLDSWSENELYLIASPPPEATPGTYSGTVDFCDGFLPFNGGFQCFVPFAFAVAAEATPPQVSITGGNNYVLYGSDQAALSWNLVQATGNPPGGQFLWSANPSSRVSIANTETPGVVQLQAINPSASVNDTTVIANYVYNGVAATSPGAKSTTVTIYRYLTSGTYNPISYAPPNYGYYGNEYYTIYAQPGAFQVQVGGLSDYEVVNQMSLTPAGFQGTVNLQTGSGSTDNSGQIGDFLAIGSNSPLPQNLQIVDSQTLAVEGIYVRSNTLTYSNSTVTIANNGPYN